MVTKATARASYCWAASSRSAAHPVRGQMSQWPLTQVVTHQPSAFDTNKHWNKLRDGGEKGERDDKIKHI